MKKVLLLFLVITLVFISASTVLSVEDRTETGPHKGEKTEPHESKEVESDEEKPTKIHEDKRTKTHDKEAPGEQVEESAVTHEEEEALTHEEEATGEHEEATAEHHEEKTPLVYYLQWGVLICIFITGLFFVYRWKRDGFHYDKKWLSYVLAFLAVLAFSLNYFPGIKEYHEPSLVGLLKFAVLVFCGILLIFYGVLGRHDEHGGKHQEVNPDEH